MATRPKAQRLPTSAKDVAALLLELAFVVVVSVALYQEWAGRERPPLSDEDFAEALAEAEVGSPALVTSARQIVAAFEDEQALGYLGSDPFGMVPVALDRRGLIEAVEEISELRGASEGARCGAVLADPASELHLYLALSVLLDEGASASALDDLVDLALHHDDSFMRGMAVGVLAQLGPGAGRGLAKGLSDSEAAVRVAAAKGLGAVECPQAVVAELQRALADESTEVSVRSAARLVSLGDGATETVQALTAGVSAENETLRSLSLAALGSLPASAGSVVVGPLLAACAQDDAEVRWQSGQALGHLAEGALPGLLEASASQTPRVRFWATHALGKIPNPTDQVVEALVARLDDSDLTVHTQAAEGMGAVILAGGSMAGIQAETMGISGIALTALLALDRVPTKVDGVLVSLIKDAEPLRQMLGIKAAVALGSDSEMVLAQLTGLAAHQDTSAGRLARLALEQL